MRSFVTLIDRRPRLRGFFTLVGALACLLVLARAQDAGGVNKSASAFAAIARSVPAGVENTDAVLPSFDATGRRTSLITARVIRRIDDDRLYAEGFMLEQYNKDPDQNVRIDLPAAHYHMGSGVLRSTERGKVSRPDMQIEGDSLIFDSQSNKGLMLGNIRTVIFDTGGKDGE
ncbi:MAG: hypothetical protein JNG86_18080 [Verrucomicrobiaceae bacterium]|nr:hypothetical protein [Verrucomicrobiaceae bacterium]